MRKITSGVYAQGSFGLTLINPENGMRKGEVMRVWFVHDGKDRKAFLSRQKARNYLWDKQRRDLHGDMDAEVAHVLSPRFVV